MVLLLRSWLLRSCCCCGLLLACLHPAAVREPHRISEQEQQAVPRSHAAAALSTCRLAAETLGSKGSLTTWHGTAAEGLALNNPARAQSQPLVLRPHRLLQ
eukprot:SAG25_NODE_133_length_14402_cov_15.122142_7_plen_101_part_00